jgi:hypothetical protein
LIAFKPPRSGVIEDEVSTAYEEGDFYAVQVGRSSAGITGLYGSWLAEAIHLFGWLKIQGAKLAPKVQQLGADKPWP